MEAEGDQSLPLPPPPPPRILAILHPLKDSYTWGRHVGFGARSGVRLWRAAGRPRFWIDTGDMELLYRGVFMWGVRDRRHTLSWGLRMEPEEEEEKAGGDGDGGEVDGARGRGGGGAKTGVTLAARPNFVDVENGASYVLD